MFTFRQKRLKETYNLKGAKRGNTKLASCINDQPQHKSVMDLTPRERAERRRKLRIATQVIQINEHVSLTTMELAKQLVLAGYSYEQIRKHLPDMPDQWWEDEFVPELSLHKERMNALAINAMYTSALIGKTDAQKCIALMQLGWNADNGDPYGDDPREPFKVMLTASPKNMIGKLVDKIADEIGDAEDYE